MIMFAKVFFFTCNLSIDGFSHPYTELLHPNTSDADKSCLYYLSLYLKYLLSILLLFQVNEIAWSTTSEIFFLTTGNGENKFSA